MNRPAVGTPATMMYPDDRYPLVVTAVSAGGHKLTLARIDYAKVDTFAGYHNGFPVHDHLFSVAELEAHVQRDYTLMAYLAGGAYYIDRSTPVRLGEARYFRDYAD